VVCPPKDCHKSQYRLTDIAAAGDRTHDHLSRKSDTVATRLPSHRKTFELSTCEVCIAAVTGEIFQVCPVAEELLEQTALLVALGFTDLLDLLDQAGYADHKVRKVRREDQEEEVDYEDLQDLQATQVIINS